MWGFFQRLFYGKSGAQPPQPEPSRNRFVKLIQDRVISMSEPKRLTELKTTDRSVIIKKSNRLVKINSDRLTTIKSARIVKVVE